MIQDILHAILFLMKRVIPFFMIVLCAFSLSAVDIEEEELEKAAGSQIEFVNYEGPHDKIETDEQIRNIGAGLFRGLRDGEQGAVIRESSFSDKYRIIHVIAPPDREGLNADIFIILEEARVDHIDNIRRILSGYIRDAYGISTERADALALFTTYYNAVYRRDMPYFESIYNSDVLQALDPEKAGLSRRYDEWPGGTQVIIPLTVLEGETVPAAETLGGDEKVVEELRTEEDKGIEERKEVVEMREEQLEAEEEQLEEEKRELQEEEEALEEMKEEGQLSPDEIEAEEEELADKREEIERREEELEERQEKIAEEREQVSEDQKEIIAREEAEREAEEQRQAAQREPAAGPESAKTLTPFIYVEERRSNPFGTLVLIDPKGGIEKRSKLNTIRTRDIILNRSNLYAVAGEESPPRTVRLVSLDIRTLEMVSESSVDVFSGTVLKLIGDSLFCVVQEDTDYFIGRFDLDLKLLQKSDIQVNRFTSIGRSEDSLIVQHRDGEVTLLDGETLRELTD